MVLISSAVAKSLLSVIQSLLLVSISIYMSTGLYKLEWPTNTDVKDGASYDYIIIGAGLGAVVASRLSEDPGVSVLLIEAGKAPSVESRVFIRLYVWSLPQLGLVDLHLDHLLSGSDAALAAIKAVQIPLQLLEELKLTGELWPKEVIVKNNTCFDYIIVGGGTAGMVVASRLTEDPNTNVLVIEAGGDPPIEALLPLFFVTQPLSEQDWNFTSTYNPYSAGAQIGDVTKLTAGKMLGGSSCLNHFFHVRSAPSDFDSWAEIVNDASWKYENVLPYFKKSERLEDPAVKNSHFVEYHGLNGPMGVARQPYLAANPYLVSFGEMGNQIFRDINGPDTLGFSHMMFTLSGGVRQCSALSYIHPVKDRENLFVLRHTYATRIIFDENKTAIAVEAVKGGTKYTFRASREIILSAGVFKSPQLLMLSGIGRKEHLDLFNIDTVVDLPIGDNWQEQPTPILVHKTDISPIDPLLPLPTRTPFPVITGMAALNRSQSFADYQLFGLITGGTTPYFTLACSVVLGIKSEICDSIQRQLNGHNSILSLVGNLQPESKGTIRLRSADPLEDPLVDTKFYEKKADLKKIASYLAEVSKIVNTTFFTEVKASLVDPGIPECKVYELGTPDFWECYALHTTVGVFHSVGTCAMGPVVDGGLRLHGVTGLRVVDASVIPNLPHGSPNALVIMIAEKASDMIKKDVDKFQSCKESKLKSSSSDIKLPYQ